MILLWLWTKVFCMKLKKKKNWLHADIKRAFKKLYRYSTISCTVYLIRLLWPKITFNHLTFLFFFERHAHGTSLFVSFKKKCVKESIWMVCIFTHNTFRNKWLLTGAFACRKMYTEQVTWGVVIARINLG